MRSNFVRIMVMTDCLPTLVIVLVIVLQQPHEPDQDHTSYSSVSMRIDSDRGRWRNKITN